MGEIQVFQMIEEIDLIKKFENISANFPDRLLKLEGHLLNKNSREILEIIKDAKRKKLKIVTTEKDYNRIKQFNFKEIMHVKIDLKITGKDKFIKKILKEYD